MQKVFQYKNVIKKFPGFQLGPHNFSLDPGIVLGFVGPNGAGKTTTMQCLVGLIKPDEGEIEVLDKKNDPNDISWKLEVGYVGDKHVFYENWTGEKNLKFISQFYPNWSDDLMNSLVKRFEIPLDKKTKSLSSGNRVKLSLISALSHRPKLLLLDEPTAGLDPVVRTEVLEALFETLESGENSIFYSTHILSDISRLADELAFIHNGQILNRHTKDELTDNWRKISFRLEGDNFKFEAAEKHLQEGKDHQVISSDYNQTIKQINDLGAENILENRMTLDEIAVQILRGGKNGTNA